MNKYILLDVLVCSIAEYFYELCHILKSTNGESKYKQRAADWLNRCSLQYKITNCPNNRRLSQDICILFKCYLYSTQCGWIISVRILTDKALDYSLMEKSNWSGTDCITYFKRDNSAWPKLTWILYGVSCLSLLIPVCWPVEDWPWLPKNFGLFFS